MNQKKKFLGVLFQCCNIYARAYLNRQGDAYNARCPRCGKRVEMRVGPDGTDSRFFTAR